MSQEPFAAPRAVLGRNSDDLAGTVGRVWGWVFAAPMLAVAVISGIVTARYWGGLGRDDVRFGILLVALAVCFVVLTLACGSWWARRFSAKRWMPFLWFALAAGMCGATLFFGGGIVVIAVTDPSHVMRPSVDDAIGFLETWIGMSLYALIQGLLIRWSLRRRARKQA